MVVCVVCIVLCCRLFPKLPSTLTKSGVRVADVKALMELSGEGVVLCYCALQKKKSVVRRLPSSSLPTGRVVATHSAMWCCCVLLCVSQNDAALMLADAGLKKEFMKEIAKVRSSLLLPPLPSSLS